MNSAELMLCIPGPWRSRSEFLQAVITAEPEGRFIFAGMFLADVKGKEHVGAEWESKFPAMRRAFEIAGQGKLSTSILDLIESHQSAVYLRFPVPLPTHKPTILKFSRFLQQIGGIAVKVESAGVAHEWERWFSLLQSQDSFNAYVASVALVGDKDFSYSCGMHHFELPDTEISGSHSLTEKADTLNRFNFWRISENPVFESGHTFSLTDSSPHLRLTFKLDERHEADDPFHNPHGFWRLTPV